ncbi:hypothetical protein KIN20_009173 [Parelaphostrongylus tenuis]|uniref:Uncharacterized protein n=1 Tax=Parelaphostrongylus tenuis TaxID=148309 RepID=A0AAD5QL41_PARTN|nr:hypothetical protein KIN20_009173 [Parelaphostrongylus tenuis]
MQRSRPGLHSQAYHTLYCGTRDSFVTVALHFTILIRLRALQEVFSVKISEGGTLVMLRDERGQPLTRIKYDREEILRYAHSPYAMPQPDCMRDIALNMPDILCSFPHRHGVDIFP